MSFCQLFAQNKAMTFTVNGLKVIFKPTQKETVSIRMYYRGGVLNYEPEQSGIENLTLSAATVCGTKNYSVHDLNELSDEYGIEIAGTSKKDYGVISMHCIKKYFDQGWGLFSDVIVNPAFNPVQFQKQKERMASMVDQRKSDPEDRIDQLCASAMFSGSLYSLDPLGTAKTLGGFTADSIKNYYYETLLNKNSMFLVVAGNLTKEELEKKVSAIFSTLPAKPYTAEVYDYPPLQGEKLLIEQKALSTNYLSCVLNAAPLGSEDYYAFRLGIDALSSLMYYELRTELGLSYAPGAKIELQQLPYAAMYVTTKDPKKAYQAMVSVYKQIRSGAYSEKYLDAVKKSYLNKFYRQQENASAIVNVLGEAEVLGGYELADNKLEAINKVTRQDIHTALNKHLKGAIWIYLGNEELAKDIFK